MRIKLFLSHERVKGLAVLMPDFHHAGALGAEVFFVTHQVTLDEVVRAVYHNTRRAREIRSKRHLKSVLNDVLLCGRQ